MKNTPIPIAFTVTHQRVEHYSDITEYMAREKIEQYIKQTGRQPSAEQIAFIKKELTRYLVIRKDLDTAQKLQIGSNILFG